jgi:hypothetical protein
MREPQGIYVQLAVSKVHAHGEAGMPRYFGGPHANVPRSQRGIASTPVETDTKV